MKILRVLLIVCVVSLLAACTITIGNRTAGSGNVITEKRPVEDFTAIDLSCSADVIIAQGEPLAVSIEGEDNILPLVETRVSGDTLNIDVKRNSSYSITRPLTVHITVPELKSIRSTGSGDVEMGDWAAEDAEVETTGSGDVNIAGWVGSDLKLTTTGSGDINIGSLEASALTARLSGSGDISIDRGSAGNLTVRTSGSGDYHGAEVQSRAVEATTSGSGGITVWATDDLSAATSGSGDIQYYGSPEVDKTDTGSGSVEKLGDRP